MAGDVVVTHAKVSAIPDDPVSSARGEVLPSDWNDDHTLVGMTELLSNIRDVVVVDMSNDNYTLTDAEAISSAIIILNSGTSKTLTFPATAFDYIPGSQYILTLYCNDLSIKMEGGSAVDFAAGYLYDVNLYVDGLAVTNANDSYGAYGRQESTVPVKLTSAALNAPAIAGEIEFLGVTPYFTPNAANRGVLPAYHHVCNVSGKSLNNDTNAQSPFVSTTLTIPANVTYKFESAIYLTTGTTSHNISFGVAGTATIADCTYFASVRNAAANSISTLIGGWVNTASATTIITTSTSAGKVIHLSGIIRVSATGTIIPQITFSAAPGGTNTCVAGSYFMLAPIGADTVTAVGNWA